MTLTPEVIDGFNYRELQAVCKENGLSARGKASDLKSRLLESLGTAKKTPQRRSVESKTAPKKRKSTDGRIPTTPLAQAASTPLPASSGKKKSIRRKNQQQNKNANRFLRLVSLFLIAAIFAVALWRHAVPLCRGHPTCSQYLSTLENIATKQISVLNGHRAHTIEILYRSLNDIRQKAVEIGSQWIHGNKATTIMDVDKLFDVLPEEEGWEGCRTMLFSIAHGQPLSQDKATSILLGCNDEDCDSAEEAVVTAVQKDSLLVVEAPISKGELQKRIVDFIKSHPKGIVLIKRLDTFEIGVLSVLINALSEQGGFEDNGSSISTTHATFILTMNMPLEIFNHEDEEAAFKVAAKSFMVAHFSNGGEMGTRFASAIRRRIDIVMPVV